eukprot:TRINITY_DN1329_c0_g1_i4.p2 TRINITY_DN1329_c0_g1~~TRINITY_DN1329_c0_g1_i4.p2  ORF type:complete len:382 (-),score=43.83 TRINITY_DN1329_c0_g1_i4:2301-3305(-)
MAAMCNIMLMVVALLLVIKESHGIQERACQWTQQATCEPNRALLHQFQQEYSCSGWRTELSDCDNNAANDNAATALVAQGALLGCISSESKTFSALQCITYSADECTSRSEFCEQDPFAPNAQCTMNNVSRTSWMQSTLDASEIVQDANGFCNAYTQQFTQCMKLTEEECAASGECAWLANAPNFWGGRNACLPSSVPLELMPYEDENKGAVSSMAQCDDYSYEALCYTSLVTLKSTDEGNKSGGGLGPATVVAVAVAAGSVLAMVGGIWFVVYVNRNVAKYQEMLRRLGINPTDLALTDFSPLLDEEDENIGMKSLRKKDSSSFSGSNEDNIV